MYAGNELIELIGKSEQDAAVVDFLAELGQTKRLKKPKRGEDTTYVDTPERGVILVFQLAETLPEEFGDQFAEGELVLCTIFFKSVPAEAAVFTELPNNLSFSNSRSVVRKLFGEPEWVSDMETADLWTINERKFHVRYSDDEAAIELLTISLPDDDEDED